MELRGLQCSGFEICGYIEGFVIPFYGAGEGGWKGGYICTSWAQGRTPDCLVAVRR
jgi:hypothetical protein